MANVLRVWKIDDPIVQSDVEIREISEGKWKVYLDGSWRLDLSSLSESTQKYVSVNSLFGAINRN